MLIHTTFKAEQKEVKILQRHFIQGA